MHSSLTDNTQPEEFRSVFRFNPCTGKLSVAPIVLEAARAAEVLVSCDPGRAPGAMSCLTDGELAYVLNYWDSMPGSTCFMDALRRISKGVPMD